MKSHLNLLLALLTAGLLLWGGSRAEAQTRYRILFVYEDDLEAVHGNMKTFTDSLIADLNTVYANSYLSIEAENAGAVKNTYGSATDILSNYFTLNQGTYDWIVQFRQIYSADAVVLLKPNSGASDWARANTDSSAAYALIRPLNHPYALPKAMGVMMASSDDDYLSGRSFPAIYYARGYCDNSAGWKTIHSNRYGGGGIYPNSCTATTTYPAYSNASFYYGVVWGGVYDTAHHAYAIEQRIDDFSHFMDAPAVLSVPDTAYKGLTIASRTGSAVKSNEFVDAIAEDSIYIFKRFTIDSGATAWFRSNRTIRIDSGVVIHAGSSVTMRLGGSQAFAKIAAKNGKYEKPIQASRALATGFNGANLQGKTLWLNYNMGTPGNVRAEVVTLDGRRLVQARWPASMGRNTHSLALPQNTRGMLLLRWTSGDKTAVRKILVP